VVFVDTSVWIAALRKGGGVEAGALRALLDTDQVALAAPVRVELLSGAPQRERARLTRVLSALPRYFPTQVAWDTIESWVERGARRGHRFGVADLLIAAITAEQSGMLWSLDSDFKRMATLRFIELYQPASPI
jgi:predicted nucleic acid-binding protein